jgi:hypothetical protein
VDLLIEDAELVADAVTDSRHLECRERIQITRGQPAQTAVAQAGFFLEREQHVEILTERAHRFPCVAFDAEVDQVVAELRADQELGRQIAGQLDVVRSIGLRRAHPARQQPVAHTVGERHIPVVAGGDIGETCLQTGQIVEHRSREGRGREPSTSRLRRGRGRGGRFHGCHG